MPSEVIRRSRLRMERLKSEVVSGSRGKRLNRDQEQEPRGSKGKRPNQDQEHERLKSEPRGCGWVSRGKPNLLKSSVDELANISKMFEDDDKPFMCMLGGILYKNKAWENCARRSHKTAYTPLPEIHSCGGMLPLHITDNNRQTLISHCHLALNDYNHKKNQGPTFVFHDLVKCTYGSTSPVQVYNITFQARTVEVSSSITTFLANVTQSFDQDQPPQVIGCHIKL